MNIRSVTAFADVSYPLESGAIAAAGEALRAAREALTEAGYTVQTIRLATQPFPTILNEAGPGRAVDFAKDLEAVSFVHEIDYVGLGPARPGDAAAFIEALPDVLANTENIFAGIAIASRESGVSLPCIRRAADIIRRVSLLEENGFANLRLAALANVPPWSPFLPAAYHGGGSPRLALATESADLAVHAITGAKSLEEARTLLIRSIETEAERLEEAIQPIAGRFEMRFQGIDFSLATFPEETRSIGAALERLGLSRLGEHGSLMAAAFLTDALDRARFSRTGFCGLMLPVLEDAVLAQRAAEGVLTTRDLLILSAVCGTGLDTIPLPGDVGQDALTAILLDVAALSLRLDKPLTARLMPIPGKQAGDETTFDFGYFTNSRVLAAPDQPLSGLLSGDEQVQIGPRVTQAEKKD